MKLLQEHPSPHIFVGREAELQTLTKALDSAAEGDGRIVMLSGEPGIGKTRTTEAVAEIASQRGFLIVNVSGDKPLLVVLDDLHWADQSSLLLLEFLIHHGLPAPILFLGTYRDVELNRRHPLLDLLGDLARVRAFERITLRGLERPNIEASIRTITAFDPAHQLVKEIHQLTQGESSLCEGSHTSA